LVVEAETGLEITTLVVAVLVVLFGVGFQHLQHMQLVQEVALVLLEVQVFIQVLRQVEEPQVLADLEVQSQQF
jgi:1,4-dihydroxy-2-naphthoate octaprenyltransferase